MKRILLAFALVAAVACSAADKKNFPDPAKDETLAAAKGQQTAVFAGGCFWGIQAVFKHTKGVISSTSGYSGGEANTADYETVSMGNSGHAESVQVVYDPAITTLGSLLKIFFSVAHDPTQLNRQGPDSGTQYRSVLFYSDPEQKKIIAAYIAQLDSAHVFKKPIVTQVVGNKIFYPAEG